MCVYYESRKRELQKRLINEGRCDERLKSKVEESTCLTSDGKNLRFTTVWPGKLVQTLMLWDYAKWQFVIMKDFPLYPLLLPQLASDALQNVPFCSGERGLQVHALLAAATPSPRQLCLSSSHLLPSLLLIQKVRFVRENCIFLVPGRTSTRFTETAPFGFSRFQPAVLHEARKKYFCTWY